MRTIIDDDISDFCFEMNTLLYFNEEDNENVHCCKDDATSPKHEGESAGCRSTKETE